ncbi:hypothetical protein AAFF_G00077960 [Aldrovandia affinis]|uniref:Uncharacterized protein n=1 Tax=Aldrovandia affinis TaxID=143900 RepID=A0AAD7RXK4_9TELE|nr:hypothetical protein AAFF_G00077960 [Aldrovandia affinis]
MVKQSVFTHSLTLHRRDQLGPGFKSELCPLCQSSHKASADGCCATRLLVLCQRERAISPGKQKQGSLPRRAGNAAHGTDNAADRLCPGPSFAGDGCAGRSNGTVSPI